MATLRNKTRDKLSEDNCRILEGVVDNFLKKDGEEAEETIWQFCYQPETELMWMGFPDDTSSEDTITIQEELASQYRTANKEWKYGEMYQNSEWGKTEAGKELFKALENKFAFDTVMQKLIERTYMSVNDIQHTLRCLQSGVEKSKFGGVRSLGFEYYEAGYLKKVANEIGNLLKEMTQEKMNEYQAEEKNGLSCYFESEENQEEVEEVTQQEEAEVTLENLVEESQDEGECEAQGTMQVQEKNMTIPQKMMANLEEIRKLLEFLKDVNEDFLVQLICFREEAERALKEFESVEDTDAIWIIRNQDKLKNFIEVCEALS